MKFVFGIAYAVIHNPSLFILSCIYSILEFPELEFATIAQGVRDNAAKT